MTEEERTRYALDIWYAHYNGIWMPSISSPTFINLPRMILNEVCTKVVNRGMLMFANFSDLIEDPDKVRQIYQCHGHTLTNTIITPSHSFIYTIESHPRPAFRCQERNQKVLFSENLVN